MLSNKKGVKTLTASEHLDADGSIVRSGMALAEAVLRELDEGFMVRVSLSGVKGASSSYFNVFLRRIDEGCGLTEIGRHIHIEFGSRIQEIVFKRSLESMGYSFPIGTHLSNKELDKTPHGNQVDRES